MLYAMATPHRYTSRCRPTRGMTPRKVGVDKDFEFLGWNLMLEVVHKSGHPSKEANCLFRASTPLQVGAEKSLHNSLAENAHSGRSMARYKFRAARARNMVDVSSSNTSAAFSNFIIICRFFAKSGFEEVLLG